MLISPKILYGDCYGRYAIPAVNVFTMEQIIALFRSGEKADAPFIVQITPAARDYANSNILLSIIEEISLKSCKIFCSENCLSIFNV